MITIGEATCFGVSEFTLPLDWVPLFDWEDIEFPGLEICAIPIDFGQMAFLGLTIDLDALAYVVSAVVLLRLFFRS